MLLVPDFKPTIKTDDYDTVTKAIDRCIRLTNHWKTAHCMALEGCTGSGKSHILEERKHKNPSYWTEEGLKVPYLLIVTPARVTIPQLARHILRTIGDPLAETEDDPIKIDERIDAYIRDCVVNFVFLDEFHHVLNISTKKHRQNVTDWLKLRIKNTEKPFLIVGAEGTMVELLKENPQLSRLFSKRPVLKPFSLNIDYRFGDDTQKKIYREQFAKFDLFIQHAEELCEINLHYTGAIEREELLNRIYYATNGVIGLILSLFRYVWDVGDQEKTPTNVITLSMLSEGYRDMLKEHLASQEDDFAYLLNKEDPFALDLKKRFELPPLKEIESF